MVFKVVLIYTRRRWTVYLLSSVNPGHPLMGRFKGGQGGNVLRVRTILCSRQGIGVIVAVEKGDRRPSFRRWTRQMPPIPLWLCYGRQTEYLEAFLARVWAISFSRSAQPKKDQGIKWWSDRANSLFDTCSPFVGHASRSDGSLRMPKVLAI